MSAKKKSDRSTSAGKSTSKKHSPAPRAGKATAAPAPMPVRAAEAPTAAAAVPATTAPATAAPAGVAVAVLEPAAAATPVEVAIPVVPPIVDVAALVAGLRDPSADAARDAAIALGAAGNPAAVEPLAAVLANADGYYHSVVRAAAAASLGQIGDTWAVPALVAAINDPMAEASAEAVRALAALGDARAVPPLVEVVRNAQWYYLPVVRRAAVFALATIGGPEADATLAAVAADEAEDAVVRQAAIVSRG